MRSCPYNYTGKVSDGITSPVKKWRPILPFEDARNG